MENLTKETFREKIFDFEKHKDWKFEGELPAIIDFYADWCGPCRAVAPVLEELSREYDGKINVYKVDTDKEQELAAMFGIRSIPSILFVPKEGQPQMAMGALPKDALQGCHLVGPSDELRCQDRPPRGRPASRPNQRPRWHPAGPYSFPAPSPGCQPAL